MISPAASLRTGSRRCAPIPESEPQTMIPAFVRRVLRRLSDPDSDASSIALTLQEEPDFARVLLTEVNSAACGMGRKVRCSRRAAALLGHERIRERIVRFGLLQGLRNWRDRSRQRALGYLSFEPHDFVAQVLVEAPELTAEETHEFLLANL